MLVELVLVTDARQEAARFEREASRQRERLEVGLLNLELVLRRQREVRAAAEIRIDACRERELGLAETEAPARRADLPAARHETGDGVSVGILRGPRICTLK